MRPRTSIKKALTAVGVVFMLCGIWSIVHPKNMVILHQSYRWVTSSGTEVAGKGMVRIYGVMAVLLGGGLIWLFGYPFKDR